MRRKGFGPDAPQCMVHGARKSCTPRAAKKSGMKSVAKRESNRKTKAAKKLAAPKKLRAVPKMKAPAADGPSGAIGPSSVANLRQFLALYHRGYEPNHLNMYVMEHANTAQYQDLFKRSAVYVDRGANLEHVKFLLNTREPVNIGLRTHHDIGQLRALFGYDRSGYTQLFEQLGRVPPNIAIYTPAMAEVAPNKLIRIHVISVVGYAFDDPRQPDYRYFASTGQPRREKLLAGMVSIFNRIFRCARDTGMRRVILSLFGCDSFATWLPGFFSNFWLPALKECLHNNPEVVRAFEIGLMGVTRIGATRRKDFEDLMNSFGARYSFWKDVPGIFEDVNGLNEAETTLFVNAWDPHSAIGNGNKNDPSVDGAFGHNVVLVAQSWGLSNPHLANNIVRV